MEKINKPRFKCADIDGWNEGLGNNTDPYGRRCFTYAHNWAVLMEARIKCGETVSECAEKTSHKADTDGITGFMYGAAVSILSKCWIHGDELHHWTQIKYSGLM